MDLVLFRHSLYIHHFQNDAPSQEVLPYNYVHKYKYMSFLLFSVQVGSLVIVAT